MTAFASILNALERGDNLSVDKSQQAFDLIFDNKVSSADLETFLLTLARKGETVDELLGAVVSMRGKMTVARVPANAMDIVGTGGDAQGTLNISTAVALVVAACGVPVAKHGNRASTSQSGSSDILAALGIKLESDEAITKLCMLQANICFLHAPNHHPAMRYVAEVRQRLGRRTIFNLLGPLTNPGNVKHHLIGVYDRTWLGPMAEVLQRLGSISAWLVHGQDGMDEISTTAPTDVVELRNGLIRSFTLTPEQVGLSRGNLKDLKGGNAAHNADILRELLRGQQGPYRDIVLFNASAALSVAGVCDNMKVGFAHAAECLDRGEALRTLDTLIKLTNEGTRR